MGEFERYFRFFSVMGVVLLAALAMSGCKQKAGVVDDDGRPVVVATTTMLEDMVRQIGGEHVQARGIMTPGADPHLYQPRPSDARLVAQSQMVVISGLHLEGWIENLVRHAGGERPVVVASERVEPIRMENSPGGVDPHFWFDIRAWRLASETVGEALVALVGADGEEGRAVRQNLERYLSELDRLHAWIGEQLATIPAEQRVLITSHDAFNYFGRAYAIEVEAIQGISTEQEASQRDVVNMIEVTRRRNVQAVFIETSVNPALIRQVARESGAKVEGPLYSDSIGTADSPARTFVGTVVENVRMITQGLGGQYTPFEAGAAVGAGARGE